MWIGVLWTGLRVAMWITHVGGKIRHGLLEKSLKFGINSWRDFISYKLQNMALKILDMLSLLRGNYKIIVEAFKNYTERQNELQNYV